jgi:hypothetical protein
VGVIGVVLGQGIRKNAVGRRFAYREKKTSYGEPVRPVDIVKDGPPGSNKVRARWLDGEYEGLEEWVPWVRVLVPWEEAEAFLRDERRELEALEASEGSLGRITWEAVVEVFDSLMDAIPAWEDEGQQISIYWQREGEGLLLIHNFEAIAPELGLDPEVLLAEPHAYVDRFGSYNATLQTALWVAKHCCRHFGQHVLRKVRATEDALRTAAVTGYYSPPGRTQDTHRMHPDQIVAEWHAKEPIFTLVREWCGVPPAESLDLARGAAAEVERLGNIIEDTAQWMRQRKYHRKAKELLRELGERPRKPRPLTFEQMAAKVRKQIEETRDSL